MYILGEYQGQFTATGSIGGNNVITRYEAPGDGTITKIFAYITFTHTTDQTIKVGIYADNAGSPGVLLEESSVTTLTSSETGWREFTIPSVSVTKGSKYWIGVAKSTSSGFTSPSVDGYTSQSAWNFTWGDNPSPSYLDKQTLVYAEIDSTGNSFGWDSDYEDIIESSTAYTCFGSDFIAHASENVTKVSATVRQHTSNPGTKVAIGIYADNSGSPGTHLGHTGQIDLTTDNVNFQTVEGDLLSSVSLTQGNKYWIIVQANLNINLLYQPIPDFKRCRITYYLFEDWSDNPSGLSFSTGFRYSKLYAYTPVTSTNEVNISENILLSESLRKEFGFLINENITLSETIKTSQAISLILEEFLDLSESVNTELALNISNDIVLSESVSVFSSIVSQEVSEGLVLTEDVTIAVPKPAPNAIKILSYNPLIFVSEGVSVKIVKVDTTVPEAPTHDVYTVPYVTSVSDIVYNSINGMIYVSVGNGKIVKIDSLDFNSQTIIDTEDLDNLLFVDSLDDRGLIFTSSESSTGELYLIDNRTEYYGDCEANFLTPNFFYGDCDFYVTNKEYGDCDCSILRNIKIYGDCIFTCLTSSLDYVEPIKLTDFTVYVDDVLLEDTDVILDTISINHSDNAKSTANFTLSRKHDDLDYTLNNVYSQITNHNEVKIYIKGNLEFTGRISELDCNYTDAGESISVSAIGSIKEHLFNNITLSLPSNDKKLGLYDVLINNPKIENPYIDPLDDNPSYYKGIKIDMGEETTQVVSRYIVLTTDGIAQEITDGTFVPNPNWTYFWGVGANKFGEFKLGQVSAVTIPYIGTSLSPIGSDLWELTSCPHKIQRIFPNKEESKGFYYVGEAPYKSISTTNGVLNTKYRWVDENDGLYSVKDESYNYVGYNVAVANAEYQKLLNINGDILPITTCQLEMTVDSYLFNQIHMLTRINIDNTTRDGIYKNNNGFPTAVKSITIDASTRRVSLVTDNRKSSIEIDEIDNSLPDPDSFIESEKRIFIHSKTDMKTFLKVE